MTTTASLVALAALVLFVPVHVLTMAAVGRAMGAAPTRISLFYGPQLYARGILVIRAIPLGGFVTLGEDTFLRLSRPRGIAIAFSGSAATALLAFALGAPLQSFFDGFWQVPLGALSPARRGAPLLQEWSVLASAQPLEAVARVGMMLAATSLLPIPTLNGGEIVLTAIGASAKTRFRLNIAGWLVMMVIAIGWVIALAYASGILTTSRGAPG